MLRALIALLFFPTVTGPSLPGDIFTCREADRSMNRYRYPSRHLVVEGTSTEI